MRWTVLMAAALGGVALGLAGCQAKAPSLSKATVGPPLPEPLVRYEGVWAAPVDGLPVDVETVAALISPGSVELRFGEALAMEAAAWDGATSRTVGFGDGAMTLEPAGDGVAVVRGEMRVVLERVTTGPQDAGLLGGWRRERTSPLVGRTVQMTCGGEGLWMGVWTGLKVSAPGPARAWKGRSRAYVAQLERGASPGARRWSAWPLDGAEQVSTAPCETFADRFAPVGSSPGPWVSRGRGTADPAWSAVASTDEGLRWTDATRGEALIVRGYDADGEGLLVEREEDTWAFLPVWPTVAGPEEAAPLAGCWGGQAVALRLREGSDAELKVGGSVRLGTWGRLGRRAGRYAFVAADGSTSAGFEVGGQGASMALTLPQGEPSKLSRDGGACAVESTAPSPPTTPSP